MSEPTTKSLSVRKALVWSFAERYASLVITLVSTMLLARLLTPAQVGVFSLCAAFTILASILRDFGISEYLIQEKDLTKDKLQAAFGMAILTAWSIAVFILLFRHAMAEFYAEAGVAQVLAVMSLNFIILPFASPAFALLNREMAFKKIFVIQTICSLVHASTAVTLAYYGHGYMSLAWAPIASIVVQTILVTCLRPKESLLMPNLGSAKAVLNYGLMFVTSRMIESTTRNAHEFIIAKQFDFGSVGIFSRAFGLIELFFTNITSAILRVASPSFATDHRAGIPLDGTFSRGTAIFTSIGFPFLGFISLMSGDVIQVLFGHQWDAAAPIASVLAISLIPAYLVVLAPNLLAATGNVKRRLQISLWYSPVHLVGILAASFVSLQAVAAIWGLSNMVMLLMYGRHLAVVLNKPAHLLFAPSLRSAMVAVVSVLGQFATLHVCQHFDLPPLVNLLLVVPVGAICWLAAIKLLKHPVYDEIVQLMARFRARGAQTS
ncbi:lipopolysaccharide biosynthesis protein [Chitinimonas sp. BJB300]|uniref:lipopolysaccharide biosynthesis protein n=1 Tax=Chitinimonas sp. BJB300 TaxID=1559339 RepID=UPI0013047ADE|nr:lipopolysaccharide biosynthesis protein [Chitinimonas sp. BJB300]